MTLRALPALEPPKFSTALAFEAPCDAIERWNGALRPVKAQTGTVIDIYDVIGFDYWTGEGITSKSITAALKSAGDVTVNINSPGGDFFEGLAIYNILRSHAGAVNVNIMGMAASAASVIAMAGDAILIGKAATLMIHNAWGFVIGNKSDMQKAAQDFAVFDSLMVGLYADRTGKTVADIAAMCDAETWLTGEEAVADNFATGLLPADAIAEDVAAALAFKPKAALRRVDAMLAERGLARSERRSLIREIKNGMPGAAVPKEEAMSRADLARLNASLKRLETALTL